MTPPWGPLAGYPRHLLSRANGGNFGSPVRKLENISRSEARLLPVLLVLLISVGCGEKARFRLWAELGSADSQFEYGLLLVPSEPREAIHWLEKAAAQGHLNAVLELVEV